MICNYWKEFANNLGIVSYHPQVEGSQHSITVEKPTTLTHSVGIRLVDSVCLIPCCSTMVLVKLEIM